MIYKIDIDVISLEDDSYHLIVKGTINDIELLMVLDTGASRTCFDINFLKTIISQKTLVENDTISSGIGTNDLQSFSTKIKSFKIAQFKIKNYQAIGIDLTNVHFAYNKLGLPIINGILGSDIFVKYNAVIDYKNKVLKLNKRKK